MRIVPLLQTPQTAGEEQGDISQNWVLMSALAGHQHRRARKGPDSCTRTSRKKRLTEPHRFDQGFCIVPPPVERRREPNVGQHW
jgi:hypothetical protein